jgi:hypothetical protein
MVFVVVWGGAMCITNPIGDFPLNDDWAWGRDVYSALIGEWQYSGWEAMPLLPQVLWGAAFAKVFGYSFTTLRLSVAILAIVEIVYFFKITSELSGDKCLASLMSLLLFFNPMNFALSNTFMTDIPFLGLVVPAMYYFYKSDKEGNDKYLWVGLALCVVATLLRQLGLVVSASYAVVLICKEGVRRSNIGKIVIIVLGPFLFLSLYEVLLMVADRTPLMYLIRNSELSNIWANGLTVLVSRVYSRSILIMSYCGLFFMPLVLQNIKYLYGKYGKLVLNCYLALLIIMSFSYLYMLPESDIPFYGNVLTRNGIGPLLLKDVYILGFSHYPLIANSIVAVSTAIALLSGAGVVSIIVVRLILFVICHGKGSNKNAFLFSFVFVILYSGVVSIFAGFYDRYIVPIFCVMPLLIIIRKEVYRSKLIQVLFLLWIIISAGFSVAATHDYFEWNRKKWDALRFLGTDLNVSPDKIDGGFEYNAEHFFNPLFRSGAGKSWWWVKDDMYLVSFGPLPGYEVIKDFSFKRFLFQDIGKIYALRRID